MMHGPINIIKYMEAVCAEDVVLGKYIRCHISSVTCSLRSLYVYDNIVVLRR